MFTGAVLFYGAIHGGWEWVVAFLTCFAPVAAHHVMALQFVAACGAQHFGGWMAPPTWASSNEVSDDAVTATAREDREEREAARRATVKLVMLAASAVSHVAWCLVLLPYLGTVPWMGFSPLVAATHSLPDALRCVADATDFGCDSVLTNFMAFSTFYYIIDAQWLPVVFPTVTRLARVVLCDPGLRKERARVTVTTS
jgi:hypothetical protein